MNQQPPIRQSQLEFLQKLTSAVGKIPEGNLLDLEISEAADLKRSEQLAANILGDIHALALLGDSKAIEALRNIGNRVTAILGSIGLNETPPVIFSDELLPSEESPPEITPSAPLRITMKGGIEEVEIFLREQVTNLPEVFSTPAPWGLHTLFKLPPSLQVSIGEIDFDQNFLMSRSLANPDQVISRTAAWHTNAPLERFKVWLEMPPAADTVTPQVRASMIVTSAVNAMVGNRLSELFRMNAQRTLLQVASRSVTWPVQISLLPYADARTKELSESLNLGTSLPFRLRRALDEPGVRPTFEPDSAAGFALVICSYLEEARRRFQNLLPAERRKLKRVDTKIREAFPLRRGGINRSNLSDNQSWTSVINGQSLVWCWNNRWELRAALLPDFPSTNEATKESKALTAWKDAALLLAERVCNGDWEAHHWPECVNRGVNYDDESRQLRTVREEVSKKLAEGIKVLRKLG